MTPTDPEAVKVMFRVLQILDRIGVPYHLGGSYASAIHGVPRQTHDVIAGEFYVDEQAVGRAVAEPAIRTRPPRSTSSRTGETRLTVGPGSGILHRLGQATRF